MPKNSAKLKQTWSSVVKQNNKLQSSNIEEMLLNIMAHLDRQEKSLENFKKDVMVRLSKLESSTKKAASGRRDGSRY